MATSIRDKKKKDRQRRLQKERNMLGNNKPEVRFHLDVDFEDGTGWKRVMRFYREEEVGEYVRQTMLIREKGDTKIFAGVVRSVDGKVVSKIEAYDPKIVTPTKGEAKQNLSVVK